MDFFVQNVNLLLFLPLVVCLIIGFNGLISNKIDNPTLFSISFSVSLINILFSIMIFTYVLVQHNTYVEELKWLALGNINFCFGVFLDKISVMFLLASTIASFVIQIFSFFKFLNSFDFPRLLFYLNLFALGLNGIFVSSNIFQTYLFSEVVGVAGYLLLSFDFSNREQSKVGIKSFIYNRSGDLALLFCTLTILYFAVFYNELNFDNALSYTNLSNVAFSMNSLMAPVVFVVFCSLLLFVIVMKFVQSFAYLYMESFSKNDFNLLLVIQNTFFAVVGLYLFLRLDTFFFVLNKTLFWLIPVLFVMFLFLCLANKLFIPFCKTIHFVEKYIIGVIINFLELIFRAFTYLTFRLQGGNFQYYILYSLVGLIFIFSFVFIFYKFVLNI